MGGEGKKRDREICELVTLLRTVPWDGLSFSFLLFFFFLLKLLLSTLSSSSFCLFHCCCRCVREREREKLKADKLIVPFFFEFEFFFSYFSYVSVMASRIGLDWDASLETIARSVECRLNKAKTRQDWTGLDCVCCTAKTDQLCSTASFPLPIAFFMQLGGKKKGDFLWLLLSLSLSHYSAFSFLPISSSPVAAVAATAAVAAREK